MKYSQRIQELPPDERPYEKCLHSGPEKLTDSELLAVVLRSGTRGSSSVQLADEVLHLGQNEQGLLGIYHLSMDRPGKSRTDQMYWRTVQADCNQRSRKTSGFSQPGHNCSVLYGTDAARRAGADDLYDVKYKKSVFR